MHWYNKYQFLLIQQITVTFFFYSIRNYNAVISEIWMKDNMRQKILGEILKRFFVTVEIYRCPGWNIGWNLLKRVWNKMSWVESSLKINKQGRGVRLLETWEYSSNKIILFLKSSDWCSPIIVAKCFFAFNSKKLV